MGGSATERPAGPYRGAGTGRPGAAPPGLAEADPTADGAHCAAHFHGDHGGGCPVVTHSDDGQTWSPLRVLAQTGPDLPYTNCGNLAVGPTLDGGVVLLAMAYRGQEAHTIWGWISHDAEQWEPVDCSAIGENRTGSVFGSILTLPGGHLAAFGHLRPTVAGKRYGIWWASSHDGGRSWGEPTVICEQRLVEPAFAWIDGRLVGHLRYMDAAGEFLQAVSDDKGATWRFEPVLAGDADGAFLAAPFVVPMPNSDRRLLALRTLRQHGSDWRPGRIELWSADARALAWQRLETLLEFPRITEDPHHDFGYPWLLPLNPDRSLLVWYHGEKHGPSPIWATELDHPRP